MMMIRMRSDSRSSKRRDLSKPTVEMQNKYDVIIIGGGVVGLCSAFYLRREGASVAVLAKDDFVDVVVEVPEKVIRNIKKGLELRIRVNGDKLTA